MKVKKIEKWFVYVLECADGSLYTGSTNDIEARLEKHNSGKGAKYTRARLPVILKASWKYKNKSDAMKAEYQFKQLSREEKQEAISRCSNKMRKGYAKN